MTPACHGFSDDDLDQPIWLGGALGFEQGTVREIVPCCSATTAATSASNTCTSTSVEERRFLQERMEGKEPDQFTPEGKQSILTKVIHAEQWEKFLARKYVGTKRFGLDGGESAVPALEAVIKYGGIWASTEIDVGMAHRGRLNVLTNVMGKPAAGDLPRIRRRRDQPGRRRRVGRRQISPRHVVGPRVRRQQGPFVAAAQPVAPRGGRPGRAGQGARGADDSGDEHGKTVLPMLLHGDAAFAGQGVVWECLSFSGLPGYGTGGTIHFIINNQVGFTTSPQFARSSPYPSDVAKGIQAPILHVNGDDPEAVTFCCKLATEFRQTFGRDIVIDMWCYRRFGHNEGDEPSFTQPLMYAAIKTAPADQRNLRQEADRRRRRRPGWIDRRTRTMSRT